MGIIKKLKDFIHRHENLEKLALLVWGIFWILRAKLIFRKINRKSPKNGSPKVFILAVRTISTTNLVYFDAIFGHAFRKLGCDVKMLYCDGVLDSCDADTVFRGQKPQCFVCKKLGSRVKNALGNDYVSYRRYISDLDIKEIKEKVSSLDIGEYRNYEYLGVNVGAHAWASTIRFFLTGQLDLENPRRVAALKKKLIFAMIMTKIAEAVFLKEKPKIIFMLHGIYATWGPFFDYFRTKSIDVIVYGNATFRFGNFAFIRNAREYELIAQDAWEKFKQMPLSSEEESQVDAYLAQRFEGIVGDQLMYKKNFNGTSKKQLLLTLLLNKKYLSRYVLYLNLAWDACLDTRGSVIFQNIFSLIDTLINYFKEKEDCQLIIKSHPAELIWEKGTKSLANYISDKHLNLPENIVILDANTPLTAYDLITPDTVCVTFNGTIGWELTIRGIPVLVAGRSHYTDAGITYPVKTLEEFLGLLHDPSPLVSFTKANIKLAKKYAYFLLFKLLIRIPFYRDDKWSTIDWGVVRNTEKLLDDNSNIIKVCKKITQGEDIVAPL